MIKKYIPNLLSQSRIILGLLFLVFITRYTLLNTLISMLILCASLITDYLDGKLARKNNAVSMLGKWIDPFSDFVFFCFVYFSFYYLKLMPLILLILFLIRELSMYIVIRPIYMRKNLDPGAKLPGKIKTVLQITGSIIIILLLLLHHAGLIPFTLIKLLCIYVLTLLISVSIVSLYWYIKPLFHRS